MPARHLYIHVPFCARRCSYCDFSIAVRGRTPVEEYLAGLDKELSLAGAIDGATLDTVYLGGGTPSRLGGSGIAEVLDLVRSRATLSLGAEVTIEANPDDVNDVAASHWMAAGVNRVSLGAQTFDDGALRWMHRIHDAARIGTAVSALRRAGITNLSLDLIFALPAHLDRSWATDVERALALEPEHLSLYGLTVMAHTPLARWVDRGSVIEGTEERYEEEFLLAHQAMATAGFEHYEVSNFARPGKRSRHNAAYWTGDPYAAAGPSAHSFDGATRRWNVPAYVEWIRRLTRGESVIAGEEVLTRENLDAEEIYLGLRTNRGLSVDRAGIERVRPWAAAGWADVDEDASRINAQVRLTPTGWLRLDGLAADLTAFRSRNHNTPLSPTPSHCYI